MAAMGQRIGVSKMDIPRRDGVTKRDPINPARDRDNQQRLFLKAATRRALAASPGGDCMAAFTK